MAQDYPYPYSIRLRQGQTWKVTFTWKINGTVQNLTGYTARMHVRKRIESDTTLVELTNSNGRIVLGGTAGTIALTLTPDVTAALPIGVWVYDLEMVSSGGEVTPLIASTFTVDGEVTR